MKNIAQHEQKLEQQEDVNYTHETANITVQTFRNYITPNTTEALKKFEYRIDRAK